MGPYFEASFVLYKYTALKLEDKAIDISNKRERVLFFTQLPGHSHTKMLVKSPFPPLPVTKPQNVFSFCFDKIYNAPSYTFSIYNGVRQTSKQFCERVQYAATALSSPVEVGGLGLRQEDAEVVGLLGPTVPNYTTLVFALSSQVIPFVPLSAYATHHELRHQFQHSRITRLFVHSSLLKLAIQAAQGVGLPTDRIYSFDGAAPGYSDFFQLVDNIRSRGLHPIPPQPVERDTLLCFMFSSGTTGLPKAVMVTHFQVVSSLLQGIVFSMSIAPVPSPPPNPADIPVVLAFMPLHHCYGLQYTAFRSSMRPTTTVYLPQWSPDAALDAIEKYRVTSIPLIPSVIRPLLERQKVRKADLSSFKQCGSGAAHLPPDLRDEFAKITPDDLIIMQGYGMSEAIVTVTATIPTGFMNGKPYTSPKGSIGVLFPGLEAQILREDGSQSDINEPGELYLRGPSIVSGYWRDEKATRSAFLKDSWLRTGDYMRVDEHGNFFFEERVKDTLKISGMQVSPREIEDTLLAHPERLVEDCAVAGVSGGRTADEKIPRAWVVLSQDGVNRGERAVIAALNSWTGEQLSKYKQLRGGIEIVTEIPRNAMGKVLRRALVESFETSQRSLAKL